MFKELKPQKLSFHQMCIIFLKIGKDFNIDD